MESRKIILTSSLLLMSFLLLNCNRSSQLDKISNKCEYVNSETTRLINAYRLNKDETKLDSALILINNNMNDCPKFKDLFFIRKLGILSLEKNYALAIKEIDRTDSNLFKSKTYYKEYLKYRFEAMDAENKHNKILRDKNLKKIVLLLNQYLTSRQNKVDSLFRLSDLNKVYSNPLSVEVTMLYYFKSKLVGKEKVVEELNIKYNPNNIFVQDIISFMDEDFMDFKGF